jgi:hypothetical protein
VIEEGLSLDDVYAPTDDVVARWIEGELVIVPLTAKTVSMDNALYTLNETGQEIWKRLDGQASLRAIARLLAEEFQAQPGEIQADIIGLVEELRKRGIVAHVGAT